MWSNREYSNIVVAFVNDVASSRSSGNMIRKKKKCVHYTQLDGDIAESPIRSITPKVKVNEVTQEFTAEDHETHEEDHVEGG